MTEEPTAAQLATVGRVFKAAIWFIAAIVIAFSTFIGHDLLKNSYNVEDPAAWILTPAVDLGLCAGLYATGVLNRYGISVGWLTALRWACGGMTLWLNCTASVLAEHPGEAFTHSFPAVLLIVLTEADQRAQGAMLRRIAAVEAAEEARAQAAAAKAEAARAADLAAAQNAEHVRAQVLADLRDELHTEARAELEPALRTELEQVYAQRLAELRTQLAEEARAQAVREVRAEARAQAPKATRAAGAQVSRTPADQQVLTDEDVAENLWELYEKHRTETGEPLSTYKVRTQGPCSSGKDLRVLALLDARWVAEHGPQISNVTRIHKDAVQ